MYKSMIPFLCMLLAACGAAEIESAAHSVRLRFVPGSAPSNPLESSNGAVWTSFSSPPTPDATYLMLNGRAAVGDKFPVGHRDEPALFEIRLVDGDDDHVALELLFEGGPKSINVKRDSPEEVTIGGVVYRINYPSIEVSSAEGISTTNKAMIVVKKPKS